MVFREFNIDRLSDMHPISEEEMDCAIIGDNDKRNKDNNYGYLYDYEVNDAYKNIVFELLEGCLYNYQKYLKGQVFSLKTADLKSEELFEFDQESLAHIYGITQSIMNPKSSQTKNFLEKIIPNYRYQRTPFDKITAMVQNKDKIMEQEKKILNNKSIFNYPKMFVKLSGLVSLKNPEQNVQILAEKNRNPHASKDDRFKYFLSFKTKQKGKYTSTTIELTRDDNPYINKRSPLLSPKSTRRDNDIISSAPRLFMVHEPIHNKTIEYNKKHPEHSYQNTIKDKKNKLNDMRNTIAANIKMKGDHKDEFSRRTSREK